MKTLIVATLLALGLASTAHAETAAGDRQVRAEHRQARHVERMTADLALTGAQKLEVEAIFAELAEARRALNERYRAESRALREAHDAQLGQVLNAEQSAKLAALRAERKAEWRSHGRGGRHRDHGSTD